MFKFQLWLIVLCLLLNGNIHSSILDYYPYKVIPTASNYGNTGILEMPNARMMPEAQLRFNFSSSFPNEFTSLTALYFAELCEKARIPKGVINIITGDGAVNVLDVVFLINLILD